MALVAAYFLGGERVAVSLGRVGHMGRRPADVGAQLEEAGPVLDSHGPAYAASSATVSLAISPRSSVCQP